MDTLGIEILKDRIETVNRLIGRMIMHTCNEIGCKECPFKGACEVERLENENEKNEEELEKLQRPASM